MGEDAERVSPSTGPPHRRPETGKSLEDIFPCKDDFFGFAAGIARRTVERMAVNPAEREDLVQEVCLRFLYLDLSNMRFSSLSHLTHYVAVVARHAVVDSFRKRFKTLEIEHEGHLVDYPDWRPPQHFAEQELRAALKEEVEKLSGRNKDILRMRFAPILDGPEDATPPSVGEIAEKLSMSRSSVSSCLFRSLKVIHESLVRRGFLSADYF